MNPLFGPGWGNYALGDIVEITVPEIPAFVPATPAWAVLALILIVGVVLFARHRYRHFRANAYRRDALEDLQQLRRRYESGDTAALRNLAPLLRSVALCGAPRREVAALKGQAWQEALQRLAPGLPPLPTDTLHRLAYAPMDETGVRAEQLFQELERWIREHEPVHA